MNSFLCSVFLIVWFFLGMWFPYLHLEYVLFPLIGE